MTLPEGWVAVTEAIAGPEAALLGDRLEQAGIPVYLRYLRHLPGLEEGTVVAVPRDQVERARTLVGEDSISEAELSSLAMSAPAEGSPPGPAHAVSPSIAVRRATTADAEQLGRLFDLYRQFYEQPADAALARRFVGERLERGESIVFLAEKDGKAVGFTQLYPTFCSVSAAPIFVLYDLFVAQEARRDGVARVLMQATTDYAAGTGAVRLELATAKTNHAAQSLYRSLGWTRDDVFDHYSLTIGG